MGKSYPDRTNATGIWKISNIYRSRTTDGTYPDHSKSRMLVHGGSTPTKQNTIDFVEIPTTGNATDFGDLTSTRTEGGSGANVSRAVFMGGGEENTIDYVHFSSQGNAADFGDKTVSLVGVAGCSNETRALSAGGYTSPADSDVIDFITIATIGNATDFGNLGSGRYTLGGLASSTRAVFSGGVDLNVSSASQEEIDFVEIASTGNAVDFGDLATARDRVGAASTPIRGFITGGRTTSPAASIAGIETLTISSLGNAHDFGDLSQGRASPASSSNQSRIVVAGGTNPGVVNTIDFFSPVSMGTATDFGDLTQARGSLNATSQSHGGIAAESQRAPELYSPTGRPLRFEGSGVGDLSVKVGGEGASAVALIGFNLISTAGNEQLFGDLTNGARYDTNGCAGDTRMFTWSGTLDGTGGVNSIDYLTFSHKGNTADFGDATETRQVAGCLANSTRALGAGGGTPSNSNVIDFITIATIGNASDFGDLTAARKGPGGLASTTRGIFAGGTGLSNVIEYVTISSASNGTDFGDLTQARRSPGAASSSTRGVFAGGRRVDSPAAESDVIDYITIASAGDAQDFGDLTQNRAFLDGTSNSTRIIFTGGYVSSNVDTIDFITIASTGNAADFGDLMLAARGAASGSNCHGGLS